MHIKIIATYFFVIKMPWILIKFSVQSNHFIKTYSCLQIASIFAKTFKSYKINKFSRKHSSWSKISRKFSLLILSDKWKCLLSNIKKRANTKAAVEQINLPWNSLSRWCCNKLYRLTFGMLNVKKFLSSTYRYRQHIYFTAQP